MTILGDPYGSSDPGDAAVRSTPSSILRGRALRYGLGPVLLLATATSLASIGSGAHMVTVVQKDRAFSSPAVTINRGDTVRFTNEDGFLHQMFAHSDTFSFDSDEQKPGENVDVAFPVAGTFRVLCGIHPKMHLDVDVR